MSDNIIMSKCSHIFFLESLGQHAGQCLGDKSDDQQVTKSPHSKNFSKHPLLIFRLSTLDSSFIIMLMCNKFLPQQ